MKLALGADCVVRNEDGDVLLLKREDFRVWTIPGGASEAGESPAQTAIRETWEETGVEIAVDTLVGVYTGRRADGLLFVYTGHPTGGAPRTSLESVEVDYFAPDALPERIFAIHRQRLLDGLGSARGLVRCQPLPLWARVVLPGLIRVRKLRNRLQGRPEPPIVRRTIVAQGVWTDDSAPPLDVEPQPGEVVWETLRRRAEAVSGHPVRVAHVIDVTHANGAHAQDTVTVRFALRVGDRR